MKSQTQMTNQKPDFKKIFNDLSEGYHVFEMRDVNLQQLASHLEELYLKIEELETQLTRIMNQNEVYNE